MDFQSIALPTELPTRVRHSRTYRFDQAEILALLHFFSSNSYGYCGGSILITSVFCSLSTTSTTCSFGLFSRNSLYDFLNPSKSCTGVLLISVTRSPICKCALWADDDGRTNATTTPFVSAATRFASVSENTTSRTLMP